jgi:distribution and morphology protein 34
MMSGSRGILAAQHPLVVPMLLQLSHFKLSSYVVLVVSKQKGITLVFKTDPLQNVDINSSFDSLAVIQKYIQKEIEGQLRQMFREDLPGIIHRLSQQWVKAKVEAPYLKKTSSLRRQTIEAVPMQGDRIELPDFDHRPSLQRPFPVLTNLRRPRSSSSRSVVSSSSRTQISVKSAPPSHPSHEFSLSPEQENFDPTYGLRPDGLPAKSGFKSFSQLYTLNRGLADLAEAPNEDDEYKNETSFDIVDWEDAAPSVVHSSVSNGEESQEYETIPAVGGGTIARPRTLHSQSQIQLPPGVTATQPEDYERLKFVPSSENYGSLLNYPRSRSFESLESSLGSPQNSLRRLPEQDPTIILRPSLNSTIHRLSTLSLSNHTLSPYTRSLSHFTVRSIPPRTSVGAPTDRRPVKARCKRIYRLGSLQTSRSNQEPQTEPASAVSSPSPPSDVDLQDFDRYFRSYDSENAPHSPSNHQSHMRQRQVYQS